MFFLGDSTPFHKLLGRKWTFLRAFWEKVDSFACFLGERTFFGKIYDDYFDRAFTELSKGTSSSFLSLIEV